MSPQALWFDEHGIIHYHSANILLLTRFQPLTQSISNLEALFPSLCASNNPP